MRLLQLLAVAVVAMNVSGGPDAQSHTVTLTVDDLPFVTVDPRRPPDARAAAAANGKLLDAFARHHVPVTGFVIQKSVENLGMDAGTAILRKWVYGGFDLGNHSYSHPDFDDLTTKQFEDQIVRGEATIVPVMAAAARKPEFFRFPFNHTDETREKHDAIAAFLAQRGYRPAPCTIETS